MGFDLLWTVGAQFKVALCQLSVTADKARNIARAREAIEAAAAGGAKLVLLPVSARLIITTSRFVCSSDLNGRRRGED